MRRNAFTTRAITILAATVVMLWSAASFAGTPTLGSDCGAGAALVGTSSDSAGKLTLGQSSGNACTLTFGAPYTNAPACSASDESRGGGYSMSMGTKSTESVLIIGGSQPAADGDTISYVCVEY